jgi:hypothetical protein
MDGFKNVTFYMWSGKHSSCSIKSMMFSDFPVLTILHFHTWYKMTELKVVTKYFQKLVLLLQYPRFCHDVMGEQP